MFSLIDLSDQKREIYGSCSETYNQWGNREFPWELPIKVVKDVKRPARPPVILIGLLARSMTS